MVDNSELQILWLSSLKKRSV